jgi:hypothetical protein
MEKLSAGNYKKDTIYPKVVKATARLLKISNEISPVTILLEMGHLVPKSHQSWLCGETPYLERVFQGSLSKANRILRIIGFHAHDLKMVSSHQSYRKKGTSKQLQFSKSGDLNIEKSYSQQFKWNQSEEKKLIMIDKILNTKTN